MAEIRLSSLLRNWEDPDVAQYYLACCLGIMVYDESFSIFRDLKHNFWTENPTSEALRSLLEVMRQYDLIEFDEDEIKYRWKQPRQ